MKLLNNLKLLLVCSMFTSCASIFTNRTQLVLIDSEPSGASILIDKNKVGTTPLIVPIKKGFDDKLISFLKEGYKKEEYILISEINNITYLNFLQIIPIGMCIDAITGEIMKYSETKILIPLSAE